MTLAERISTAVGLLTGRISADAAAIAQAKTDVADAVAAKDAAVAQATAAQAAQHAAETQCSVTQEANIQLQSQVASLTAQLARTQNVVAQVGDVDQLATSVTALEALAAQ